MMCLFAKNVVLHRTHLRNISDQDFKILEEVYQELGTLYNREKRKHRFDKNTDSIGRIEIHTALKAISL
jgi:hypothetical protein